MMNLLEVNLDFRGPWGEEGKKVSEFGGGSPGLVVMGGDLCPDGCG